MAASFVADAALASAAVDAAKAASRAYEAPVIAAQAHLDAALAAYNAGEVAWEVFNDAHLAVEGAVRTYLGTPDAMNAAGAYRTAAERPAKLLHYALEYGEGAAFQVRDLDPPPGSPAADVLALLDELIASGGTVDCDALKAALNRWHKEMSEGAHSPNP